METAAADDAMVTASGEMKQRTTDNITPVVQQVRYSIYSVVIYLCNVSFNIVL